MFIQFMYFVELAYLKKVHFPLHSNNFTGSLIILFTKFIKGLSTPKSFFLSKGLIILFLSTIFTREQGGANIFSYISNICFALPKEVTDNIYFICSWLLVIPKEQYNIRKVFLMWNIFHEMTVPSKQELTVTKSQVQTHNISMIDLSYKHARCKMCL